MGLLNKLFGGREKAETLDVPAREQNEEIRNAAQTSEAEEEKFQIAEDAPCKRNVEAEAGPAAAEPAEDEAETVEAEMAIPEQESDLLCDLVPEEAEAMYQQAKALEETDDDDWTDELEAKIFRLYSDAAAMDHLAAMTELASCYEIGIGTQEDAQRAVELYLKAARRGYAEAQHRMATLYDLGELVQQDYNKAFRWYKKAAEQGHAEAMYDLANAYILGQGTEKNERLSFEWYLRASELGYAAAMDMLAIDYEYGSGTEKDLEQAKYWREKAKEYEEREEEDL